MLGAVLLIAGVTWYGTGAVELLRSQGPPWAKRERERTDAAPTGNLPALYLDLGWKDYLALQRRGEQALSRSTGEPEDGGWIPASARYDGRTVAIQLRCATDPADWREEDKWPLEVEVLGSGAGGSKADLGGMRSFTARSPAARGYLSAWVYADQLRNRDILAPRYQFVQLWVGGRNWGAYALEEGLSGEFLASTGRVKGVIVGLDGALEWQQGEANGSASDQGASSPIRVVDAADIALDPVLREQRDAAVALLRAFQLRELPAEQVFDVRRVGVYAAHANLWGAWGGAAGRQAWFYYNPLTARLEPIAHNTWPGSAHGAPLAGLGWYQDPAAMAAYLAEAAHIVRPRYLDDLRAQYATPFEQGYLALAQEFSSTALEAPWSMLVACQPLLEASLHPSQTVHAYRATGEVKGTIDVRLCNLLPYPVLLRRLRADGGEVQIRGDWLLQPGGAGLSSGLALPQALPSVVLRGSLGVVPQYVILRVPAALLRRPQAQGTPGGVGPMQVVTQIAGSDRTVVVDVLEEESPFRLGETSPEQPSLDQALARHPFLVPAGRPGFVALRPGTWSVEGDLVLPDGVGLMATGPVTLAFDPGAALVSSGPLLLQGTPEEMIRLLPKTDSWGGILVFRADPATTSSLSWVEITGAEGIQRGDWASSGGVTFYESPVEMRQCTIQGSTAGRGVWVVRSRVGVWDSLFQELGGDALVIDQGQGRLERSRFREVRGNAVTAIGTRLEARDVTLSRVYGFGLSARQGSDVRVENLDAADLFAVLLSKDRSSVRAQEVRIARSWAAGFIAHQEAMVPGPGEVWASGVDFEDDSVPALVQDGSQVTINGKGFGLRKLDVGELYRRRELLSTMEGLNYKFGAQVELAGYDMPTSGVRSGGVMTLTLYWYGLAEMAEDYTSFVHILDDSGQQVAGWDNMPCQNGCPTSEWRVGRLVADRHPIPMPAGLPAGEYAVAIGLYYLPTGERLPVQGPGGETLPNAVLLLDRHLQVVP